MSKHKLRITELLNSLKQLRCVWLHRPHWQRTVWRYLHHRDIIAARYNCRKCGARHTQYNSFAVY